MSPLASWLKLPHSLRHFAHFVLVGAVNTCFGYGVYAAGVYLGLPPPLALLIAVTLGACFNFFSLGKLVFRRLDWKRVPQFFSIYGVNYLANAWLLARMQEVIPSPYLAQLVILPLSAVFMFFLLGHFVFGRRG